MASSVTLLTTTSVLATTEAFALSGPTKLIIEAPGADDVAYVYEETATEGTYQKVAIGPNQHAVLSAEVPSFTFEGYGNYKILLDAGASVDAVIGYVA